MNGLISKSGMFLKQKSPTILTCVGAAGVVATAVSAAKSTPKALTLIAKAEEEKQAKLTKWEKFKASVSAYIPSIILGASTITCIFGANILNKRSQALITSAYTLLDNSYKEYKNKVKDMYGEESHNKIINAMSEDRYEEAKKDICLDQNEILFFDFFSLQFFKSTMDKLQIAEHYINEALRIRGYATLAEFYDELGVESTDVDCALGWSTCNGYDEVEIFVKSYKGEDGDENYTALMMSEEPTPLYFYT